MVNSMPAPVTIGDINGDGYIDLMYAIDITGQIFRFDLADSPQAAADFASGGMIADLGDVDNDSSNDADKFRRFYNPVDAATFLRRSGSFITLAVGFRLSGQTEEFAGGYR